MTKSEEFIICAEELGCKVEVTQPDDTSGYTVMDVTFPNGKTFDVTVQETLVQ